MYFHTYATINLNALDNNIHQVKKMLAPKTKIMCVLKADAYGHGAIMLAQFLENKIDYVGVANLDEALELRSNGVELPILILGCSVPEEFNDIVVNNITQTVFDFPSASSLSKVAAKHGKTAKIHIAVDTGMTRIGFFDDEQGAKTVKRIEELSNIDIEGVFSHYACADASDKTSANLQTQRFLNFTNLLESMGINIEIKHMCNSAGIIDLDNQFNMVRLGISLFGLYPSEQVKKENLPLERVMELKSRVSFLKTVQAGCGVSYGHTYITEKPTKIATIPVGYADGYPRALSSKGRMLVKGQVAPIIGRVCMDQTMLDVTHIDELKVGDEITIMGKDGENLITSEEIGEMSESFNYEVICGVGRRVPRIYCKNGEIVRIVSYLKI
ncbi:MAG TPA: alanine racemase [Clostridia bacterium]|nr:alanine racemase [Clostridia bacterium]